MRAELEHESGLSPVTPLQPLAPYVGGKRNLAKRLDEIIAATPHTTYAEPFVGMGGVFLRRSSRPRCEVINDLSGDVATFFRILQRHYVAFLEMMRFQLTTRAEFDRLKAAEPSTLTDLERAARFLYLQRTAFRGMLLTGGFRAEAGHAARFDPTRLQPMLEALHERLAGVTIERLPFDRFVRRYDTAGTLFFLDPPYWGTADYYAAPFSEADYEVLAELLTELQGRFILTINDVPATRALFGRFDCQPVDVMHTSRASQKSVGELIVSGGAGPAGGR